MGWWRRGGEGAGGVRCAEECKEECGALREPAVQVRLAGVWRQGGEDGDGARGDVQWAVFQVEKKCSEVGFVYVGTEVRGFGCIGRCFDLFGSGMAISWEEHGLGICVALYCYHRLFVSALSPVESVAYTSPVSVGKANCSREHIPLSRKENTKLTVEMVQGVRVCLRVLGSGSGDGTWPRDMAVRRVPNVWRRACGVTRGLDRQMKHVYAEGRGVGWIDG